MKWSLKIGTFAGIAVYLHWTFALLIGWIFMTHLAAGETAREALAGVGFIMTLFGCVLLHEYGHALTARHYGVKTRDITLLPVGGIARLESIPVKPMQEFWVAVAGPAVNVVIAAMLFILLLPLGAEQHLTGIQPDQGRFLARLMWVNLFIVAFNLLPAFPMDGGRILRSLLAARIGRPRATVIAASIGQAMAVGLGIIGFFTNPILFIIAIVVFIGAQAEAAQVEIETTLEGVRVRDAMMTRFRTLHPENPLAIAVEELLAGSQLDFPVLNGSALVGILRRDDLIKALADGRHDATVADVMCREPLPVNESDDLTAALESMTRNQCGSRPVMEHGRIIGLLTLDNINEFLMLTPRPDPNLKPLHAGGKSP